MTIVRHTDLRQLGYCNTGSRSFFQRHGLDWRDFLHNGIEADRVEAINDAMAQRVVEQARAREAAEGGQ